MIIQLLLIGNLSILHPFMCVLKLNLLLNSVILQKNIDNIRNDGSINCFFFAIAYNLIKRAENLGRYQEFDRNSTSGTSSKSAQKSSGYLPGTSESNSK